jgi:hypothetical protein
MGLQISCVSNHEAERYESAKTFVTQTVDIYLSAYKDDMGK